MDAEIEGLQRRARFLRWLMIALIPIIVGLAVASLFAGLSGTIARTSLILAGVLLVFMTSVALQRYQAKRRMQRYQDSVDQVDALLASTSSAEINVYLSHLKAEADVDPIICAFVEQMRPAIRSRLEETLDSETKTGRRKRIESLSADARKTALSRIEVRRQESPAIRAQRSIAAALEMIRQHKADAERQLDEQREKRFLKWWFDLNRPDFADVDAKISQLEQAQQKLIASGDIERTNTFYDNLAARVEWRTRELQASAVSAIPESRSDAFDEERTLRSALLLGALTVPVSAWGDMTRASDIYDSLREVNGNYAEMSDFDIWLDTLLMPGEQLVGLAALTKGAYFEKLVETDFGGERFAHFNHPDTDIVIDGVAHQIKATDSLGYIESVGEGIPVISTSEVASLTASIDGGYTNADLTESVDLALGGTVLDIGDTALDALLTGIGGMGLIPTISGISSAWRKYRESGDAVESMAEGMSVAVANTARAGVNMMELAWRGTTGIATSRPIRFAGRLVGAAVQRMDRWIEDGDDATSAGPRRQ